MSGGLVPPEHSECTRGKARRAEAGKPTKGERPCKALREGGENATPSATETSRGGVGGARHEAAAAEKCGRRARRKACNTLTL
jgi:hypothetical protein